MTPLDPADLPALIAQGEGDLTARLKDTSGTETQELAEWFNTFVEQVHGIIREVAGNSAQVNQASALSEIKREEIPPAAETPGTDDGRRNGVRTNGGP